MAGSTSVVVVGGGLVGAAAAWRLAAHGHRVTLVEQFGVGHRHGASHGTSRIFRHAYADPTYVQLAARALTGWLRLERQTGAAVYERTGAVDHGDPAAIQQLALALGAAGLEFQILSSDRGRDPLAGTAVRHRGAAPPAGRPAARRPRGRGAVAGRGSRRSAVLRPETPVRAIRPRAGGAEVVLDDEVLRPDQVVVGGRRVDRSRWSAGRFRCRPCGPPRSSRRTSRPNWSSTGGRPSSTTRSGALRDGRRDLRARLGRRGEGRGTRHRTRRRPRSSRLRTRSGRRRAAA